MPHPRAAGAIEGARCHGPGEVPASGREAAIAASGGRRRWGWMMPGGRRSPGRRESPPKAGGMGQGRAAPCCTTLALARGRKLGCPAARTLDAGGGTARMRQGWEGCIAVRGADRSGSGAVHSPAGAQPGRPGDR